MDFGIALPSLGDDASRDGIAAAVELAEAHGFGDVWTTDHLLVDHSAAVDYGRIYEAVTTMAWIAGRFSEVRIGASVIVVPMRNAVVLAKELATIDELSEGRLIAGFGVGWSRPEFENVGVLDQFAQRGAYLEETIELCRHLWSGSADAFHGRFHQFEDFVFGPLPTQGANLPIWIGGRDERALRRVGRLADAYHSSATSPAQYAPRIPIIREAAESAGRPMPRLSARVRIALGAGPESFYTLHGSAEDAASELRSFAELGIDHVTLAFASRDRARLTAEVEAFVREVKPLL